MSERSHPKVWCSACEESAVYPLLFRRWECRFSNSKAGKQAGLGLDVGSLLAGEDEVAGPGLTQLCAPPLWLHDASGGVAGMPEKEMAEFVGDHAT